MYTLSARLEPAILTDWPEVLGNLPYQPIGDYLYVHVKPMELMDPWLHFFMDLLRRTAKHGYLIDITQANHSDRFSSWVLADLKRYGLEPYLVA